MSFDPKGILMAIAIFAIGWVVAKLVFQVTLTVVMRKQIDQAAGRFIAGILQYLVLAAALISALDKVGVASTSLVALLGSAGIAIGLALQGNLANFASGVLILWFRPFTVGDVVDAGGHTGKVEEIGIFATTMLTPDNKKIIIPNSGITGGSITNITVMGTRRGTVEVGVAYGADVNKVVAILEKAANACELVHEDPAPAVAFTGLGASSLDFAVHCWCDAGDYLGMLHEVRTAVYNDLNKAKVDIPFNQIVVHQAS